MGYACPVCETPQRDGEHLAHHLAFTAMLHGGDHEEWLAEHAPEWVDREPEELAADVVEHAEETEYHEVFEDTVHDRGRPDVGPGGAGTGHEHDHGQHEHTQATAAGSDPSGFDEETRAALEEARDLTRRMLADEDERTDGGGDETGDDIDDATDDADDADIDDASRS